MGIQIKDIVVADETSIEKLENKTLAVDTFNMLYQFLTTIRQPDGSPLTDSSGNVTSHLIGLFSRTTSLMQKGIRPVFVFDGKPPELKSMERQRRADIKKDAERQYDIAKEREDIDGMKKFAARTTRLTPEMVQGAKELVGFLGLPIIKAPSEGEAQAAYITRKGDAYATVSQDYDTLLHASPRLVRNLSIAGKRKKTGKLGFSTIKPEMIVLSDVLNSLGIDQDQLIAMSMLIGTDYNKGGIKGIGQKKALALVKDHGKDFESLFSAVGWDRVSDIAWNEIFYQIKNMPVTDDYKIRFGEPDYDGLTEMLCKRHDFSAERVSVTVDRLKQMNKSRAQKGLSDFF